MARKKVKDKSSNDNKKNTKNSKPNPKVKRKTTKNSIKNSTRSKKTLTNKTLKEILNESQDENKKKIDKGRKNEKRTKRNNESNLINSNGSYSQATSLQKQKTQKNKTREQEEQNMEPQPSTSGIQSKSEKKKQSKEQSIESISMKNDHSKVKNKITKKIIKKKVESKSSRIEPKRKGIKKEKYKLLRAPKRRRGNRRVASLNASAKVKLLCENDKTKTISNEDSEELDSDDNDDDDEVEEKPTKQSNKIKKMKNKKDTKKITLIANKKVDKTKKTKKRKIKIDSDVEIIDTKRCKRMASLNASAMMAAICLPPPIKEKKTVAIKNDSDNHTITANPQLQPSCSQSNPVIMDQMVHEWSSTVEERIEMTTVQTMVQLGHDNAIVETISTQYEQQNKIMAKSNNKNNKSIDNVVNKRKNKIKTKTKNSTTTHKNSSSPIASSSKSKTPLSAFTPCPSSPIASSSATSFNTGPIPPAVVCHPVPTVATPNFVNQSFPTINNCPIVVPLANLSDTSTNQNHISNKTSSKSKRSTKKSQNKVDNSAGQNRGQSNSIVQKYTRKIATRMESSSNPQSSSITNNQANFLPNGITFLNNLNSVKNRYPIISANPTATTSVIGNNLSYNVVNPTPFQVIPFVSHVPHNPQATMPSVSLTNLNANNSYAVSNLNAPLYHPGSNAASTTTSYANVTNHQQHLQNFYTTPIPFVQLATTPSVPVIQSSNGIQSNPSLFGLSYLNSGINNHNQNIFNAPINQYVNMLGSNQRILTRPFILPESGRSTTTPTQIINLNCPNMFPNLINYSLLNRQQSVTSIRPMSIPINTCFPQQQTFLVQAPILNPSAIHLGQNFASKINTNPTIPVTNNLQSTNTLLKSNNSLHIPQPINGDNNNGTENVADNSNNQHSKNTDKGNNQNEMNQSKNHVHRRKNLIKTKNNQMNKINNHSNGHREPNANKKLVQNGFLKTRNKSKIIEKTVLEGNGSKNYLRNRRRNLLLSDKKNNHVSTLTDVEPISSIQQQRLINSSLANHPIFNGNKKNRRPIIHGWSWEGESFQKLVFINNEEQFFLRKCYSAIKHNEGEIIRVRDCVLLKSGPRKTDLPFVAKIASLWESAENEMMMSLLWYYRPKHTEIQGNYSSGELFASRHRDANSVACIDDKCFVLTFNEFCRYQRQKIRQLTPYAGDQRSDKTAFIVPKNDSNENANNSNNNNNNNSRLPPLNTLPELVFCCRKVYDFRQKRILKNPS